MTEKQSDKNRSRLPRVMGLFSATMLGVGAMIGAGIFLLSGIAAGYAGPAVIVAFMANGLIALAIGGCYAELGSAMPRAGGSYFWIKQALGQPAGFFVGWISFYANVVAASLYALGFASFLGATVDYFGANDVSVFAGFQIVAAIALTACVTLLHYQGAKDTTLTENIITSLKIALLFLLVGGGLVVIGAGEPVRQSLTPFMPNGLGGIAAAMAITFVAFEGFEVITRTGEELKSPEKNIPRAIYISITITVSLYVLIGFVLIAAIKSNNGMPSWQYLATLGELGMASTAIQIFPYGDLVFYLAGIASTVSAMIAATYSAIRVAFAMGRQGDLPSCFAAIHKHHQSPHIAAVLCGGSILLTVLVLPVTDVASAASQMFALLFAIVCLGAWRLRVSNPHLVRPFRLTLLPLFSSVGICSGFIVFIALIDISPLAWSISIAWIIIGSVVWVIRSKKQQNEAHIG